MIVRVSFAFVVLFAVASATDVVVPTGTSVQAGIVAAQDGDRVLVDPGVYTEAINFLGKDVQVIGVGGAAGTTIDATGLGVSVVTIDGGVPSTTRLEGFTIRGGLGTTAAFPAGARHGGGVYVGLGSPIIERCVIEQNSAQNGIGGGAFLSSTTQLVRCVVRGNMAAYAGGVAGGQLEHVLVQDNQAAWDGGGAAWTVSMRHCRLDANVAGGIGGGAVLTPPGDSGAEFCSFTNNQAQLGGGVYVADAAPDASVALRRCRIEGNSASQGGGIWMVAYTDANAGSTGSIALESCTLRLNTAQSGVASGAYLDVVGESPGCATVATRQCVFDANDVVNASYATFDACIFVNHPNPVRAGIVNWSVGAGGHFGFGSFTANPLFVDPAAGDLHLTAQSPCLGASPTQFADADIDGDLRVDPTSDIGADEFETRLYVHGIPAPGAAVMLRVVGTPGDSAVLFVSMTLNDAPIDTPFGAFALGFPLLPLSPAPLGVIPANGVLGIPLRLPASLPLFSTIHAQCLLQGPSGGELTKVETLVSM